MINLSCKFGYPIEAVKPDRASANDYNSSPKTETEPSRHRFEKPIHNVKKLAAKAAILLSRSRSRTLHHLDIGERVAVCAVSRDPALDAGCALGRAMQRWPAWFRAN
jgi:hypothetical protein